MASELAPFVPPHCPRTECRFHGSSRGWRWRRHGSFTRASTPHRIPRFRCGHCGHRPRAPLREPLVVDGFESFAYSQYHPHYLNLVVGACSHYGYAFTRAATA